MDCKLEHQNIRTLSQLNTRSQFLKKIAQLLVSISLFSLLLSHFSNLSYLHSLTIYFPSNISLHLLSQTIDKNTMFLLCNGLLVFMKISGLISSSSTSKNYDHNSMDRMDPSSRNYTQDTLILEPEEPVSLLDKEVLFENSEEKAPRGNQSGNYMQIEAEEEKDIKELATLQEKEDDKEEGGEDQGIKSGFLIFGKEDKEMEACLGEDDQREVEEDYAIEDKYTVVDGSEGEEGNGVLSIEELNKVFDEFIRKMKEEIRIEAQQQLVVVK